MENNFRKLYDFWSLKSYAEAEALAAQVMAMPTSEKGPGVVLAYDYGYGCSPQFGIIRAPVVGDDVSYGFNGDYYPCGKVEQIGKDYKRVKAGGQWYYRHKLSPGWVRNHTWQLIRGIHNERNPSF